MTLVDAWGAGNSRSSSGDETRLIRTMYNGNRLYTDLAVRALSLWRDAEAQWARKVFIETGVLYLFEDDDDFAMKSIPLMRERGVAVQALTPAEAATRFPQIAFDGVRTAYFEPNAGVLLARAACELVRDAVVREGGAHLRAHVHPGRFESSRLSGVTVDDGRAIDGDAFVFACGPWLGTVFPDVVGDGIAATRQDVMYFGTPAGDCRFDASAFPGWINFGAGRWYGMASHEPRVVKIADDVAGPPIDPTSLDRVISADAVRSARAFLRRRFPALAVQPVVESRVCQYEYAPDADFLLDRHPAADNVWLAGGGSGHGFKMGPAVGEYVARLVLDHAVPDGQFTYAHFADGRRRVDRADGRKIHW